MFGIIVEKQFCATHQLRLPDGTLEPLHGHDWIVRAFCRAGRLDEFDMVLDFHVAEQALASAVAAWHHQHLNTLPAFAGRNPTAELVAFELFRLLKNKDLSALYRLEVTEAPNCIAFYEEP